MKLESDTTLALLFKYTAPPKIASLDVKLEFLMSPSVPLMNAAPPRLAVLFTNVESSTVAFVPLYQLIAPPSSDAVLFSK